MECLKRKCKLRLGRFKVLPLMWWTILASFMFEKHYLTMCSGLSYLGKANTSSLSMSLTSWCGIGCQVLPFWRQALTGKRKATLGLTGEKKNDLCKILSYHSGAVWLLARLGLSNPAVLREKSTAPPLHLHDLHESLVQRNGCIGRDYQGSSIRFLNSEIWLQKTPRCVEIFNDLGKRAP